MTPYSFAFTIIRTIAVLMLSLGVYSPLGLFISKIIISKGENASDYSFVMYQLFTTALPGLLLYFFAHWLAKIATWKIKDSN